LIDLVIFWFVALLLLDSRGKTRILGFVAVSTAVGLEVYRHYLSFLGTSLDAGAPSLKLLLLVPFVWLLFEGMKKTSPEVENGDGNGRRHVGRGAQHVRVGERY
jgi:hypothetical protein